MRVFYDFKAFPEDCRNAAVAIGNFDGVHKGHQALLARTQEIAEQDSRKLAVLTFEPHPRALFRPDEPPQRITPAPVKFRRLSKCGVDYVVCAKFDWDFASQSAEAFVKNVLVDGLNAAHVIIGEDFRFGQLRKGDADTIRAAGIPVTSIPRLHADDLPWSSSDIRTALRHGDIERANAMLGWEWEIAGVVGHGDKRGRELGYPTANIALGETIHPAYGVYAALIKLEDEEIWRPCAVNIGIRPMFEAPLAQLEAFIFDFNREIYGRSVRVKPVRRIRSEAKFDSLEKLIAQMDQDCIEIKKVLM